MNIIRERMFAHKFARLIPGIVICLYDGEGNGGGGDPPKPLTAAEIEAKIAKGVSDGLAAALTKRDRDRETKEAQKRTDKEKADKAALRKKNLAGGDDRDNDKDDDDDELDLDAVDENGKPKYDREHLLRTVRKVRREAARNRTTTSEQQKQIDELNAEIAKRDKEAASSVAKIDERTINALVRKAAADAGMVDMDGLKLFDKQGLKLDENGEIPDLVGLISKFKTAKPNLFGVTSSSSTRPAPRRAEPSEKQARDMTDDERRAKGRELGLTGRH